MLVQPALMDRSCVLRGVCHFEVLVAGAWRSGCGSCQLKEGHHLSLGDCQGDGERERLRYNPESPEAP